MNDPIISTREQVGDYDAIETLKPGEPVFPIQGGDPLGPATVQFWADEYRKLALEEPDEKKRREMLRKALAAEQVGWAMRAYQRGEEIDGVELGRSAMTNLVVDDGHKWTLGLVSGTHHLREAAAQLSDAAGHLPKRMARALRTAVKKIEQVATEYEPRRASYGNEPELPMEGAEDEE